MKCIVLAGGNGGSLWPISRKEFPQQFVEIREGRSVFQENIAKNMPYCDEFYIFTNEAYRFIVEGQLEGFQELKYKLFLEKEPVNTTLPVILGCMSAHFGERVLVIGCNGIIDAGNYTNCVVKAKKMADESSCVMFGVPIEKYSKQYGYINEKDGNVELFVEKPSENLLKKLINNGNWLWNVDMYLMNTKVFLSQLKENFSDIYFESEKIFNQLLNEENIYFIPENINTATIFKSFERNIIENIDDLKCVEIKNIQWYQLNDYESLALVAKDEELNNVIYNETTNTTVINHSEDKLVVVNGTEDIVVVNTDDAVYIKSKNAKHNIKDFIVNVKKKFGKYTDRLPLYYRAWGTYQILSEGMGYKVKKVTVFPNKKMSLHKHSYRSEHWSVVEGVALIELEGITMEFEAGENVYVPAEAYHRISNESNENVVIIEVEIGDYLNEQDIVSKNYKDLGDVSKEIIKLSPAFKDYLWGGNRLVTEFDKNCDYDVVAESWELSAHKAGNSIVTNGRYKGLEFGKYLEQIEDDVVGWKCVAFEQFPMLIKFIDAKKPLSIQVHPDDDFAMSVEKEYGKNEMWYIMDCDEDAFVYCGFKEDITKEEIKTRIENHTITDVLNKIYVKKGDAIYIPAGTVHAIGSGILICEIQQSSNSTYRLYDYDRKDKDGNLRELHIEKALQVINTNKYEPFISKYSEEKNDGYSKKTVCSCKYFQVFVYDVKDDVEFYVDRASFNALVFLDGFGTVSNGEVEMALKKGDTFFLPAGIGNVKVQGECKFIVANV